MLQDALLHEWLDVLGERARGDHFSKEPLYSLDLPRLEGSAACFLCSTDPDVRRAAWDVSVSARALHAALAAAAAASSPGTPQTQRCSPKTSSQTIYAGEPSCDR